MQKRLYRFLGEIDNSCFSKREDNDSETLASNTHTLLRRPRFQQNDSDFH